MAVAIAALLMALLLPAIQAARDSARRSTCANNLRNQTLAIHTFCAAHQHYPAGRQLTATGEYSWGYEILPHLDQAALYFALDRADPWSEPHKNLANANANLKVFRCPSALAKFDGKTDFGGILGSLMPGISTPGVMGDNGVLVEVGKVRQVAVRPSEVSDGTSHTLVIAECTDRPRDSGGRWISGFNCVSHNNGGINERLGGDIHSRHAGGAYGAFADGKVVFLSQATDDRVVAAMCTRCGGENLGEL